MNVQMICGDIGGTKTLLQAARLNNGVICELNTHRYQSNEYACFSDVLSDFLNRPEVKNSAGKPEAACFAVAGPVTTQHANLTNLPWQIDATEIARTFAIPKVRLLNDFEAAALAIDELSPADLITLQEGCAQPEATRVILGAGTGMGVAWLIWQNGGYQPVSTEAGHIDFAPVNALQLRLLESLQKKFHHVSVERLLSGSGLTQIFNFLQTDLAEIENIDHTTLDDEDSGAVITQLAYGRKHAVALKSLELFTAIYGAFAGNLALAGLCRSGVYIAGGIAPKILDTLQAGYFMHAFRDKGRFSALLREIPVNVITHPAASLLGARRKAQELLSLRG
ncbi:MAG: glucokinase [Burkholderiales bacterium]|nr:glucokinase [Burkholderiales bacterium]